MIRATPVLGEGTVSNFTRLRRSIDSLRQEFERYDAICSHMSDLLKDFRRANRQFHSLPARKHQMRARRWRRVAGTDHV